MVTQEAGEGGAADTEWVVLAYRAVREPSRHRVGIWRRLKDAGALYLQDAVAALPSSAAHRRLLTALAVECREHGGDAVVLTAAGLGTGDQLELVARFNAERDREYAEITAQCRALLGDVERETAHREFVYAALEDTESNLTRLRGWADKVRARDFLDAPGGQQARTMLEACEEAVESFAAAVHDHHDTRRGQS